MLGCDCDWSGTDGCDCEATGAMPEAMATIARLTAQRDALVEALEGYRTAVERDWEDGRIAGEWSGNYMAREAAADAAIKAVKGDA